jgi:hypothetical protein
MRMTFQGLGGRTLGTRSVTMSPFSSMWVTLFSQSLRFCLTPILHELENKMFPLEGSYV